MPWCSPRMDRDGSLTPKGTWMTLWSMVLRVCHCYCCCSRHRRSTLFPKHSWHLTGPFHGSDLLGIRLVSSKDHPSSPCGSPAYLGAFHGDTQTSADALRFKAMACKPIDGENRGSFHQNKSFEIFSAVCEGELLWSGRI